MKKIAVVLLLVISFSFIFTPLFAEELPSFPLDKSKVNSFDRAFMQPYNGLLDDTATIVEFGMLAAPGAFLLVPEAEWLSDGLMYAATGVVAFGARTVAKKLISRARPCMYYDSYPAEMTEDDDWNESCPSGHTTMCFASAAFVSYMFNTRYSDSQWKLPAVLSAYSIAAVTGGMRVASGNHFVTDVLAGAALGTMTGYVVPWAFDQVKDLIGDKKAGKTSVTPVISPFSLGFLINF